MVITALIGENRCNLPLAIIIGMYYFPKYYPCITSHSFQILLKILLLFLSADEK